MALRRLCYDGSSFRSCESYKTKVSTLLEESLTHLTPGLLVALRRRCDGSSPFLTWEKDKTNVNRVNEANETHLAPGLLVALRRGGDGSGILPGRTSSLVVSAMTGVRAC